VQLEEEKVDEFEDILTHIICGQAFAEEGTEEELTVQLGFVSAIRCHDPCAMELLNHDVPILRNIKWYNN
jgi:hypothetical protein